MIRELTIAIDEMYAKLVTDHSAVSYNSPSVLLIDDDGRAPEHLIGVAYDPADTLSYDTDTRANGTWHITASELVSKALLISGDRMLAAEFCAVYPIAECDEVGLG